MLDKYIQSITALNHYHFLIQKYGSIVSEDIKQSESLEIFKTKIENWIPLRCPCRLCRTYLQNIGFF